MAKIFIDTNVFYYAAYATGGIKTSCYMEKTYARALFQSIREGRHEGFYSDEVWRTLDIIPDLDKRDGIVSYSKSITMIDEKLFVVNIRDYLMDNGLFTNDHIIDASSVAYSIAYGMDYLVSYGYPELNPRRSDKMKEVLDGKSFDGFDIEYKLEIDIPRAIPELYTKMDEDWIRAKRIVSARGIRDYYIRKGYSENEADRKAYEVEHSLDNVVFVE